MEPFHGNILLTFALPTGPNSPGIYCLQPVSSLGGPYELFSESTNVRSCRKLAMHDVIQLRKSPMAVRLKARGPLLRSTRVCLPRTADLSAG